MQGEAWGEFVHDIVCSKIIEFTDYFCGGPFHFVDDA